VDCGIELIPERLMVDDIFVDAGGGPQGTPRRPIEATAHTSTIRLRCGRCRLGIFMRVCRDIAHPLIGIV